MYDNPESVANFLRFCLGQSIHDITNSGDEKSSVEDIFEYTDKLESNHSFIQWVFPTPRTSEYNSNCPILSEQDIDKIKNIRIINEILLDFKNFFFDYWGIIPENKDKIRLLNGHNGLRLSRAIECLTLFNIDVREIFPILEKYIELKIIHPKMENYKGEMIPIWFVRFIENR